MNAGEGTGGTLQAVLFDLDGVLVQTADMHYQSWQRLADELGLPFDRETNEGFRGVGRMECLEKLLGPHRMEFAPEEKQMLAERKNSHYQGLIATLRPQDLAPGALALLMQIKEAGVPMALVSASKNARTVVDLLQIANWFDAIVDGTMVSRSKPDPQAFVMAAERLGVLPECCVVIEDADAGIRAAVSAGMKSVGIGPHGCSLGYMADMVVDAVGELSREMLEGLCVPEVEINHVVGFEGVEGLPVRLSA